MKQFPCWDFCFHCKRLFTRVSLKGIYCSEKCLIAWDEARQVGQAGRAATARKREAERGERETDGGL